ncbi:MAG: DUF4893 domain-containing protein [Sphingomonadales bacterium]|nr:DUF4893 domain-containing protein [Sphingomonadales bacterium]
MAGRTITTALLAAASLSGCAYTTGVTGTPAGADPEQLLPTEWHAIATRDDRVRLAGWRSGFNEALGDAAAAGFASEIAAHGDLLQPDAALGDPRPPAGFYRCRFIKLGAQDRGLLSYIEYPWFRCRIEDRGATLRLTKLTGSQRPTGTIYPDNRLRMVFLGVLELGDETRAHVYGRDANRDMIGQLERIGDDRWRIVFPRPRFESLTDVMELVPAE